MKKTGRPINDKRVIMAIACAFGILLSVFLAGCGEDVELTAVSTAVAKPVADPSTLVWHGYVEALRSLDVASSVSGKVSSVEVEPGQRVKAGDILFMLDSADSILQLKQAEAGLQTARTAAANAAAANSANTLVTPARIARDDAQENVSRLQALFDASAVSEADLDAARSRLETAESQLQTAQLSQRSTYESTQAQLGSAQVAVEIAAKRLEDCTVVSLIDGLVARVNYEPGAFISPQAPMLTLFDDSRLQVKIQVMETDIGLISPGMELDIFTQSDGQTYAGIVERVDTMANTRTGMFDVVVYLRDAGTGPRLGVTADVRLQKVHRPDTVLIPKAGVDTENDGSVVYIVESGIVTKRSIEIVSEKDSYLEIAGLKAGDEVVVGRSAGLVEGERVRVMTWQVQP